MFILFSESEAGEAWYYSSVAQLDVLIDTLDRAHYEAELVNNIEAMRDQIVALMGVTVKLTDAVRGVKRSALSAHDGMNSSL